MSRPPSRAVIEAVEQSRAERAAAGLPPAPASWVPREGQARVIHLPEPRTT